MICQPRGLLKIHRRDLPPEPKWHRELAKHPLGNLFEQAEKDHLQGHESIKTWIERYRKDPLVQGKQILDCM